MRETAVVASGLIVLVLAAAPVHAQTATQPPAQPEAQATTPPEDQPDPDRPVNPGQPEYTFINLPTTLRVPKGAFAFRVTHRFGRDLTAGGFGDLLEDFFGFDSGALIGLELRYGIVRGWQAGIYRTSDRTIQLFTQYNVVRQGEGKPLNIDVLATLEGTNNLRSRDLNQVTGRGQRSPALGAVVSRVFGRTASVALTTAWVNNTNPLASELAEDDDTVILGVGGRLRVRPTVYLVGEVVPRIAGHSPGTTLGSFGLEKRVGGHAFQVNFSNGIGSTIAQIARGAVSSDSWHIGFNINRKF